MKKLLFIISFMIASVSWVSAQRLAYVDSEYVMKHIPEYTAAQKQLDALSTKWQAEVDKEYAAIEDLYQAYQKDQASLNADMRRRREDEIVNKEKQVKELQRQKFGFEGDLYKERVRLIEPLQNRVNQAIADLAKTDSLDLVLDKQSEVAILFANPALDKSDVIITKLGLKPNHSLKN